MKNHEKEASALERAGRRDAASRHVAEMREIEQHLVRMHREMKELQVIRARGGERGADRGGEGNERERAEHVRRMQAELMEMRREYAKRAERAKRLRAEGQHEEAEHITRENKELAMRAREMNREIEAINRGGNRERVGERPPVGVEVEHLMKAIEHLRAAGHREVAGDLERHVQRLREGMHRGEGERRGLDRDVRDRPPVRSDREGSRDRLRDGRPDRPGADRPPVRRPDRERD